MFLQGIYGTIINVLSRKRELWKTFYECKKRHARPTLPMFPKRIVESSCSYVALLNSAILRSTIPADPRRNTTYMLGNTSSCRDVFRSVGRMILRVTNLFAGVGGLDRSILQSPRNCDQIMNSLTCVLSSLKAIRLDPPDRTSSSLVWK